MFSQRFNTAKEVSPAGFRYRGIGGSRLEQLTDGVFAFAVTLLVISSEVPKSYLELEASMYSFIGFVFCILLLLGIWNHHRNFFLHYGLQDKTVKVLNFILLFVLLYYIYPLKFLFSYIGTAIYARLKMSAGDRSEGLQLALDRLAESNMDAAQWSDIMIRFGFGLFLIYGVFFLLHRHAMRQKEALELDMYERYETKTFIQAYGLLLTVTVLSMTVVLIFGGEAAAYSGGVYALVAIVLPWHRRRRDKKAPSSVHRPL
jgi:hypothetical protein